MDNTLQTRVNLNQSSYIKMPQQQPEPQNPVPKETSNTKINSKNILLASLGGLAVLGGSVVWVINAKRAKIAKQEAIIREALKRSLGELKVKIKDEYIAARNKRFGTNINLKEQRAEIIRVQSENEIQKTKLTTHRDKQTGILRKKITDLQNDNQWIELRKIRKNMIKIYSGETSKDEKIIAQDKISMINDLLITKTYPEEEIANFRELYGMEPNTAFELISQDFKTAKEYRQSLKNAQSTSECDMPYLQRTFLHKNPLRLENLFPDEIRSYTVCNKEIKKLDNKLVELNNKLNNDMQILRNIATEFRTSKNVIDLKEGLRQLNVLNR